MLNNSIGKSPDFSTDGSFPKCWKREHNEIYLIKTGSSRAFNAGYEPFSEIFACQLADYLSIPIVKQELINYKGITSTKCKCICTENTGLVKLNEFTNKSIADFKWLKQIYRDKIIDYMLMLDYLLCNVDRHFGNIWLYIDNDTNKVKGFTEICDNNLSCIPYYVSDENLIDYINSLRAKDSSTWKELLAVIDKRIIKEVVYKARHFKFTPIGNKKADSRINILNTMITYQLNRYKL